jgi:hypothetical protein
MIVVADTSPLNYLFRLTVTLCSLNFTNALWFLAVSCRSWPILPRLRPCVHG